MDNKLFLLLAIEPKYDQKQSKPINGPFLYLYFFLLNAVVYFGLVVLRNKLQREGKIKTSEEENKSMLFNTHRSLRFLFDHCTLTPKEPNTCTKSRFIATPLLGKP